MSKIQLLDFVRLISYSNSIMNITSMSTADQMIPVSEARSNLSSLIKKVGESDYFVLVNKYKPKAALINIYYLEKLMKVYNDWKREQDFLFLDKMRESLPKFDEGIIENDIKEAIKAVRSAKT